jgi:protease-4
LVDSLGTLRNAVEVAARQAELGEGPYRVRILPRPRTFLDEFSEALNARVMNAWTRLAGSPAQEAFLQQARTLGAAARLSHEVQARVPFDISIE